MEEGSLINTNNREKAVELIKSRNVVGFQFRGVFGLCLNAEDEKAVATARRIKGEENLNKPFAVMMFTEDLFPFVDIEALPEESQHLFEDPGSFKRRIGSLCHVRFPLIPEMVSNIPPTIRSEQEGRYYLHNLDPTGHGPMSAFIRKINEAGVPFVAVTSLNKQGKPEICTIDEARRFIEEVIEEENMEEENHPIKLLLKDPTLHETRRGVVKGSYTIIDPLTQKALREGNVPVDLVEKLVGFELDKTGMKPPSHSPPEHSEVRNLLELGLTPEGLRAALLLDYKGFDRERLRQRLKNAQKALNRRAKKGLPPPKFNIFTRDDLADLTTLDSQQSEVARGGIPRR